MRGAAGRGARRTKDVWQLGISYESHLEPINNTENEKELVLGGVLGVIEYGTVNYFFADDDHGPYEGGNRMTVHRAVCWPASTGSAGREHTGIFID
ncbi:MAG TPA: hypothetical protein VNI77_06365 [Nitrososphaera sp.]|nr:hypothetical protein [Nitrososphaera sp.]